MFSHSAILISFRVYIQLLKLHVQLTLFKSSLSVAITRIIYYTAASLCSIQHKKQLDRAVNQNRSNFYIFFLFESREIHLGRGVMVVEQSEEK
jgi:hypothetical protein